MNNHYRKSGYLLEDFRLFYNSDSHRREIPFHYHDFHKLLILLSGNTSYIIEGKMYALQPGDIVLVRAGQFTVRSFMTIPCMNGSSSTSPLRSWSGKTCRF